MDQAHASDLKMTKKTASNKKTYKIHSKIIQHQQQQRQQQEHYQQQHYQQQQPQPRIHSKTTTKSYKKINHQQHHHTKSTTRSYKINKNPQQKKNNPPQTISYQHHNKIPHNTTKNPQCHSPSHPTKNTKKDTWATTFRFCLNGGPP